MAARRSTLDSADNPVVLHYYRADTAGIEEGVAMMINFRVTSMLMDMGSVIVR